MKQTNKNWPTILEKCAATSY